MKDSGTKEFLERLKVIVQMGPNDQFRLKLREICQCILDGKEPMPKLIEGLRPLFQSVVLSFLERGDHQAALYSLQTLKKFKDHS
jgi:hypothetical protein